MITSLAVFCGASLGYDKRYSAMACEVGIFLAKNRIKLVYGGGGIGLMGEVANKVSELNGEVVGVIPQRLFIKEVAHQGLTDLRVVENMHQRKDLMYQLSDAFLILPGGMGTMDEFFEILTWKQLGLHQKPIIILNENNYFSSMLNWIDQSIKEGFIKDQDKNLFQVVDSIEAFKRMIQS
jgi:uncharacterized protein (TIGR00730 family)